MNKKTLLLFVACLVGLLSLQIKVILPWMNEIAASDLFLVESKDQASQFGISNDMTNVAFANCNSYIKAELGEETTLVYAEKPTKVWSLGNYEYIVNADIDVSLKDEPTTKRHYACRLQYENGDDLSGAASIDNWKLLGIDGLHD